MRQFRLLVLASALSLIGGCCTTEQPSRPPSEDSDGDVGTIQNRQPEWDDPAKPHWLRGPWENPREFLEDALLAIDTYSFGNAFNWNWYTVARHMRDERTRNIVGDYQIISSQGRRPFPVVIRATVDFEVADIPLQHPDTLVPIYGNKGLVEYLRDTGSDEEVLILYLGHYDDGWIPLTYVSLTLRWASLDPETGELQRSGDFHTMAGWVYRRTWEEKPIAKLQIETLMTS